MPVFSCPEQVSNIGKLFFPVLCYSFPRVARKPQIIFGFGADSNVAFQ